MKTLHLTGVTVLAKEGLEVVDLEPGFDRYLVFYPSIGSSPYLNIHFLNAELRGSSITCRNTDEIYPHEVWVVQYNHPLPPFFQVAPWQILAWGKLKGKVGD